MKLQLMKNPHKVMPQLFAASIGAWGFFCTGTVRGWSSPGIPSLNETKNFEMNSNDLAWIASMPPLCALVGALLIGVPMQFLGRRKALMGVSIPFCMGFLIMGFTYFGRHKGMLYFGRLLSGMMNGAATPASQIYISECASPRVRGILSSLTASALALGILVAYIMGTFVDWYVLAWILGCFPLVLFIGMLFLPETPIWLLSHNRENEARASLQQLRGKRTNIEIEFQRMNDNLKQGARQQESIKPKELLKGSVLKPLGVSMALMFFQQFTGINAMVFYTVSIFQSAGSTIQKHYATIIIGFVQLIFTVASGLFVDRFGRRFLLFCSGTVVAISLASMGAFFYMQYLWGAAEASAKLGWLPLLSLIVFFIAYSGGYANVPFIIMGELFPSRYRSVLGSLASSFNLLCTFTVVRSFPPMQIGLGKYGAFWFFMCCTMVSLVFVYFFVPETKGKTLEEIEKFFSKKFNKDGTASNQPTNDERSNGQQIKFNSSLGTVETGIKFGTLEGNKQENGNSLTIKPTSFHPADSEDEEDSVVIVGPVATPI